jgi:ketosteroid isomerase-like protein
MQTKDSGAVVQGFFAAFRKGDFEGLVGSFHPDAEIVAVRPGTPGAEEHYGTYRGREGAGVFVATLGKLFDTKAFAVDHVVSQGELAFASGTFTHHLRTTGKPFTSHWALRCLVKDGTILRYHFYEDSAAFAEASR